MKQRKRPEKFVQHDEESIRRIVWDIWQVVGTDLFAAHMDGEPGARKIHVTDFMDCVHSQLPISRSQLIPTADAEIARDAEREGKIELAQQIRKQSGGHIAQDVHEVMMQFKSPYYHWAWSVAEAFMRTHADKRGYLH